MLDNLNPNTHTHIEIDFDKRKFYDSNANTRGSFCFPLVILFVHVASVRDTCAACNVAKLSTSVVSVIGVDTIID
jgi:hypothetical protein